jgi:hypothetical protein
VVYLCLFVYSILLLNSNGITLYWVPFIGSVVWWYFRKSRKRSESFNKAEVFNFALLIFLVFITFFLYFIGFDLQLNDFHFDYLYYGSLADHLAYVKSEWVLIDIPVLKDFKTKSFYSLYHYTEIWLAGILSKPFSIPSLRFLFLVVYPGFLVVALISLFYFLQRNIIQLAFREYLIVLLIYLGLTSGLVLINNYYPHSILNLFIGPYELVFTTALFKLIPVIIILLFFYTTIEERDPIVFGLLKIGTVGFLYPTTLPIIIPLYLLNKLWNFLKLKDYIILMVYALLIILFVLGKRLSSEWLHDLGRPLVMDLVRFSGVISLGMLSIPRLQNHKLRKIALSHLKTVIIFSFLMLPLQWIKPYINYTFNFYQIIDNVSNVNSKMIFVIYFIYFISKLKFRFKGINILVFTSLCIYFLLPKNLALVSHTPKCELLKYEFPILAVRDTVNSLELPYYENPYLFIRDKSISWDVKNVKVINLLFLKEVHNEFDRLHNERVNIIEAKLKDEVWVRNHQLNDLVFQ